MSDDTVPIEGLVPWVESGDLAAIVEAVARWYDPADGETDMAITISSLDVASNTSPHYTLPSHHHSPSLTVAVTNGPHGFHSRGSVKVWRGADPATVAPALDRCLAGCRAANAVRREKGTYYAGPDARGPEIELTPRGEGHP